MPKRYRKYAPAERPAPPPGALVFKAKEGKATAYVFNDAAGRPLAKIYLGDQTTPYKFHRFGNAAQREKFVISVFRGVAVAEQARRERAEAKRAYVSPHKIGDVLRGSWGYDQTNVDFFEVVGMTPKTLAIRELCQGRTGDGFGGSSKCVPMVGQYRNDTVHKVRAQEMIRSPIHGYLHAVKPTIIAGVPVYDAVYWSADH